jgi:putative transposase
MMAGRLADEVDLSAEERGFLEAQVRRHKAARSLSDRCRMILLCAEGLRSKEVAARLGVHEHTVGKWRRRFVKDRIEGLTDEYRPGRPRSVSDAQLAEVIERTLNSTPRDATHWSIRTMAAEVGLSHTTIRRIWTAFGLQPHRSETFKLSSDPLFVDKVQDIVGLYLSPPNRAIVLCVDEKSQIQALDREQPVLPMAPGVAERRTHSYVRNGTTSLFAALDIATGRVIGKCYKRHRATEFLDFLKQIDRQMPEGSDLHLVMDNYATHKTPKIKAWLARRPHWQVHFTPTSASWINQVERWFAELTRKQLQRGVHRSTAELEADIAAFIEAHNESPKPYKWVKSADDILASVKRFCPKPYKWVKSADDILASVKRFCQRTQKNLCAEL